MLDKMAILIYIFMTENRVLYGLGRKRFIPVLYIIKKIVIDKLNYLTHLVGHGGFSENFNFIEV